MIYLAWILVIALVGSLVANASIAARIGGKVVIKWWVIPVMIAALTYIFYFYFGA